MSNKRQIKKIKTLQGKLNIPEEEYVMLLSEYWVNSCTKLSFDDAEAFIRKLEARAIEEGVWQNYQTTTPTPPYQGGESNKKKYDDLGKRPGMASPKQLRMIEAMWKDASWTHDTAKRAIALRKFIFKIAGVDDLTFLTSQGVQKVVKAIENIKRKHTTHTERAVNNGK
jgi:hypothetical protein